MAKTPFLKTKAGLAMAIIIGIILIFFIGSEYRAYKVRKAIKDVFTTSLTDTAETPTTTEETLKKSNIISKNIGDEVELATMKIKVNGSEEKQTLNSGYGTPAVAKANAKFVVVNLDVTNTTREPFNFSAAGIPLIDSQQRTYSDYEKTIEYVDNYLSYRTLSPSITENGVMVYELPNDAISYAFTIGKAGTNDVYMIKLK